MKSKPSKKRLKEIREVYRTLGIETEKIRKYFTALGNLSAQEEQKKPIVFIEAGTKSLSHGEYSNARLE